MRIVFLTALLLVAGSASAAEDPRAVSSFDIELEGVPRGRARADLLNMFIRENANQVRIDVTLVNKREVRGRSSTLYYLENLRVRPGDVIRVRPEGRLRPFEAKIQFIETFFPTGKPPQFVIRAFGKPDKDAAYARPYPRLSTNNFRGRRTLVEKKGKRKPDLITCFGDTPGDLRIRFHGIADVVNVGRAFSTTYRMTDVQHRWDANNGLQTRYQGERYVAGRKKTP